MAKEAFLLLFSAQNSKNTTNKDVKKLFFQNGSAGHLRPYRYSKHHRPSSNTCDMDSRILPSGSECLTAAIDASKTYLDRHLQGLSITAVCAFCAL